MVARFRRLHEQLKTPCPEFSEEGFSSGNRGTAALRTRRSAIPYWAGASAGAASGCAGAASGAAGGSADCWLIAGLPAWTEAGGVGLTGSGTVAGIGAGVTAGAVYCCSGVSGILAVEDELGAGVILGALAACLVTGAGLTTSGAAGGDVASASGAAGGGIAAVLDGADGDGRL